MNKKASLIAIIFLLSLTLACVTSNEEMAAATKAAATVAVDEARWQAKKNEEENAVLYTDLGLNFSDTQAEWILEQVWGWKKDQGIFVRILTVSQKEGSMSSLINQDSEGRFIITLPKAERAIQENLFICALNKPLGERCYWK